MKRGAVLFTVVSLLAISSSCSASWKSERGEFDEDFLDYGRAMVAWFDKDAHFSFELSNDGRTLRDELSAMSAPRQMIGAHRLLLSTYSTLVFTDEARERLEERDSQVAKAQGHDEVPQCFSGEERARGVYSSTNSEELDQACLASDAAYDAYLQAEFAWSGSFAEACEIPNSDLIIQPDFALELCLE